MRRLLSRMRGPLFWAKALQIALLCIVTFAMMGAGKSPFDRIGHNLMCSCGCGQVLLECNHVSCPDSPVMISELRSQIAAGGTDKTILDWFAAKYGAIILAAPIRGGFDNAAWIVPTSVFLLATVGTFAVVWVWKRRAQSLVEATPAGNTFSVPSMDPQDAAMRERIRRETEY